MVNDSVNPLIEKCVKCIHRNSGILSKKSPCFPCVFYDNKPNFKEDVRVTTNKLDEFTIEKYPQYL
jgi:hypothetical protein